MAAESPSAEAAIPKGCPLDRVFRLLSGEWRRRVEGISSKVLTDRLRMLEAEGAIFRDYEPTVPPKVTYGLTAKGQELDQALQGLQGVADRWS